MYEPNDKLFSHETKQTEDYPAQTPETDHRPTFSRPERTEPKYRPADN